jgi:hypothetical protein
MVVRAGRSAGNDNNERGAVSDKTDTTTEKQNPGRGRADNINVTVVAPNNASRDETVNLHDRVDKVAREAVKEFVNAHEMDSMECSLALIIDSVAAPLDDTSRIEETAVRDGARLVLIPKKPKTDG